MYLKKKTTTDFDINSVKWLFVCHIFTNYPEAYKYSYHPMNSIYIIVLRI